MTFTLHKSFSELVNKYDGFILDQFGVMHNGKESLPGAVHCVETLASLDKKLIILSNTSSPSQSALDKLPKLGFDPKHFIGAVTSGEEASRFILEHYGRGSTSTSTSKKNHGDVVSTSNYAKKCILLTWADDTVSNKFLDQCGNVEITSDFDEADFVIAHGSQVFRNGNRSSSKSKGEVGDNNDNDNDLSLGSFMDDGDLSQIEPILQKCKERNLHMICANPDFVVKIGDGSIAHMPGKIATKYMEMGGKCTIFGKPHEEHFKACLRELKLEPHRVAHVGDSLHHDICGANAAGIPSIFIMGGIHSDSFCHVPIGELPTNDDLVSLFEREDGHFPTHVTPLFQF